MAIVVLPRIVRHRVAVDASRIGQHRIHRLPLREAVAPRRRLRKGNRREEGAEHHCGEQRRGAQPAGLSTKKLATGNPVSSILLHGGAARCNTASYTTLGSARRELLEQRIRTLPNVLRRASGRADVRYASAPILRLEKAGVFWMAIQQPLLT